MTTQPAVNLCNQALRMLGEYGIASFDEGTDQATTVSLIYADTIRLLLTTHPWRFTLRKAQLARLTQAPLTEWRYQHALPADSLALRALYPTASPGAAVVPDYEIFANHVVSNTLDIWADYQVEIDAGLFPAWFQALARCALAGDFAMAVGAGSTSAEAFHRRAFGTPSENLMGGLMGQARRLDSQQQPPQRIRDFPLIAARFGGSGQR